MSHRAGDPRHGPRRLGWQETVSLTEYERFYPVILRVSKTIHFEASPLLYASFCFELVDHWNPNNPMFIRFSTYLRSFLQLIGRHNSTLIRHMIIPFLAPSMEKPYRSLIMEDPSCSLELEPLSKDRVLALQLIQDKCTGIETLEMAFDPAWSRLSTANLDDDNQQDGKGEEEQEGDDEAEDFAQAGDKRRNFVAPVGNEKEEGNGEEEEGRELNSENSDEKDDLGDLETPDDFDDLTPYDEDKIVVDEDNPDFESLALMKARFERIPTLKSIIINIRYQVMSRRNDLEDRMCSYGWILNVKRQDWEQFLEFFASRRRQRL
jgi:hypothetical protein